MDSRLATAVGRFAGLFGIFVLLGVTPAAAGGVAPDGVIELDQSCALSGCATGGDLPGFPIDIVLDGHYRLTGNLTNSDGGVNAITIAQGARVTIDLNGFVIRGAYGCPTSPPNCPALAGYGIRLGLAGWMTLRNGTITGIGNSAILLDTSSIATVEQVTISHVGSRGIDARNHVTVRDSTIYGTQGDGIHALFARISDTRVFSTRGDGVEITDRGLVSGLETNNTFNASLRLHPTLGAYTLCRLDGIPVGGLNFGDNACASSGNGICP